MKIIKYPQSNFLVEADGSRILIDPGILTFKKFKPQDFGSLDAIFVSHQHPDHLEIDSLKFWSDQGIKIYGNSDVVTLLSKESIKTKELTAGKEIKIGGFNIDPVDLPHFKNLWCNKCNDKVTPDTINNDKKCKLHPKEEPKKIDGPPNTGFIINELFFHPGDGMKVEDLSVKSASIPIGGPTVDYEMAWDFVDSLKAQAIIPMHYSIAAFGSDPREFSDKNPGSTKVAILEDEGYLEIT